MKSIITEAIWRPKTEHIDFLAQGRIMNKELLREKFVNQIESVLTIERGESLLFGLLKRKEKSWGELHAFFQSTRHQRKALTRICTLP